MQKFKIRAWNVKEKIMEYITDLYWFEEMGVHDSDGEGFHAKYIFMLFIGLLDKNGKEIYGGDIVDAHWRDGGPVVGTIGYSEKWATFYLGVVNKYGVRIALESVHAWYYDEETDDITAEVVGNIYQNPELVPKGNE